MGIRVVIYIGQLNPARSLHSTSLRYGRENDDWLFADCSEVVHHRRDPSRSLDSDDSARELRCRLKLDLDSQTVVGVLDVQPLCVLQICQLGVQWNVIDVVRGVG